MKRRAAFGDFSAGHRAERLHKAFRQWGRTHRNAGVLCAILCADVPAAPAAHAMESVESNGLAEDKRVGFVITRFAEELGGRD